MVKKLVAALCALSVFKKTHHHSYKGIQPLCDTPLPVYLNRFFGICYTYSIETFMLSRAFTKRECYMPLVNP